MPGKKILFSTCFVFIAFYGIAQEVNLDSLLDAEIVKKSKAETQYTEATFKTSRLINSHTVETTQKGVLDFKISHRFSSIENKFYDLFGFDNAINIRFGADYGISKRLTVGFGRSSFQKEYDGYLKYRLLWQSTGKKNMPLSITLLSSVMLQTLKEQKVVPEYLATLDAVWRDTAKLTVPDRLSYAAQVLIARKFSSAFSLQIMPTLVHYNLVDTSLTTSKINGAPVIDVDTAYTHKNFYSIGIGARLKLTKRSAIIAEYYYQLPGHRLPRTHNSFSLGYEVETGGHVFQFTIGNSTGITERTFITETREPWSYNNLHLGFNISRVFTLKKPKDISYINPYQLPIVEPKTDTGEIQYAQATFKTTRLINGHTVETTQSGVLDLKVTHRFGAISSGIYNMFGLDQASMRIGVDYGINDRLTFGAGRSAGGLVNPSQKEYDAFLKYRLLWQSTGIKTVPISLTLLSSVEINTLKETKEVAIDSFKSETMKLRTIDRLYYAFQALMARKLNESFSLQLVPTLVHYNLVDSSSMSNNLFSIGIGTRIKLTKRSSLNVEYYAQLNKLPDTYNSFSIGYEVETGGHVFQFHLTNSTGMTERTFITQTTDRWNKGEIHIGFNISRVFTVKHPKEQKL